jgi:hypothetical protein
VAVVKVVPAPMMDVEPFAAVTVSHRERLRHRPYQRLSCPVGELAADDDRLQGGLLAASS